MSQNYNPHDIHTYPYSFEHQMEHSDPTNLAQVLIEKVEACHTVLQAIHQSLTPTGEDEMMNEKFIQLLFKPGFGANWIPVRRGKFYIYVYAPVATVLNVTSNLGAPFLLTIPAPTFPSLWNLLDLPEMSSIMLDVTATANQMNIFVLLTDKKL